MNIIQKAFDDLPFLSNNIDNPKTKKSLISFYDKLSDMNKFYVNFIETIDNIIEDADILSIDYDKVADMIKEEFSVFYKTSQNLNVYTEPRLIKSITRYIIKYQHDNNISDVEFVYDIKAIINRNKNILLEIIT